MSINKYKDMEAVSTHYEIKRYDIIPKMEQFDNFKNIKL